MSCSGAGRGRGWLNLNKNATTRPGGTPSITNNYVNDVLVQDLNASTLNSSQYERLVTAIDQLDPNDDGIKMNQKFKHILQTWKSDCNSSAEVEESFKHLYSKCQQDANLASKVVNMVSSYSFISTEIHDCKIRTVFIGHVQNDFENSKQLQASNSTAFRNSIRMLGEFYNKARLSDGRVIKFLAVPILHYLDMLLESAQPADLELFTSQLYLNGASIKADCPQRIQEILMQVRHILLNNTNLTQTCRTWMLLALDVVYNRFGLLPSDLQKFYQEQLGDKAMANFQGTHSVLSIQTSHSNKTLDGYQSMVNVLQVTPPESTSPVSDQTNNSHNQFIVQADSSSQGFSNSHNFNSQSCNLDWENAKDSQPVTKSQEKVGRPILGVGARLQRNRVTNDSSSTWNDHSKENSTGWDNKHKSSGGKPWGSKKGHSGSKNKGWEHDDRFENDY